MDHGSLILQEVVEPFARREAGLFGGGVPRLLAAVADVHSKPQDEGVFVARLEGLALRPFIRRHGDPHGERRGARVVRPLVDPFRVDFSMFVDDWHYRFLDLITWQNIAWQFQVTFPIGQGLQGDLDTCFTFDQHVCFFHFPLSEKEHKWRRSVRLVHGVA